MASVPAYRLLAPGEPPAWCEVDVPVPQPGEALVRMGGGGLCRTDLELLDGGSVLPFSKPFALGHENAGWVEQLGPDVTDLAHGDAVVVSAIRSCGDCRACLHGFDNYCLSGSSRGLRENGGIASFMVVDRRQLIPLGDLEQVVALTKVVAVRQCVTRYPFTEVMRAYEDLREGRVEGRAVLEFPRRATAR